jgi:hypothetical protein
MLTLQQPAKTLAIRLLFVPRLQLANKPSTGITIRQIIQRYLESQWVCIHHLYYLLTDYLVVLHPRHKLHYFRMAGWEDEWIETACTIVRDEFDRLYAFMDVDNEVESRQMVRA